MTRTFYSLKHTQVKGRRLHADRPKRGENSGTHLEHEVDGDPQQVDHAHAETHRVPQLYQLLGVFLFLLLVGFQRLEVPSEEALPEDALLVEKLHDSSISQTLVFNPLRVLQFVPSRLGWSSFRFVLDHFLCRGNLEGEEEKR